MTNFETTMAKISQSASKASELDRVSEAIVRLSQQTHIVALNARIEAARAGEAGAAFSVVSLAVRDLAGGIGRGRGHRALLTDPARCVRRGLDRG